MIDRFWIEFPPKHNVVAQITIHVHFQSYNDSLYLKHIDGFYESQHNEMEEITPNKFGGKLCPYIFTCYQSCLYFMYEFAQFSSYSKTALCIKFFCTSCKNSLNSLPILWQPHYH